MFQKLALNIFVSNDGACNEATPPNQQTKRYWIALLVKAHLLRGENWGKLANFASHFIHVQIYQMDLPLILFASKYLR